MSGVFTETSTYCKLFMLSNEMAHQKKPYIFNMRFMSVCDGHPPIQTAHPCLICAVTQVIQTLTNHLNK